MDQRTDRRTDGRTDGRTDRLSYRDARTHLKIVSLVKEKSLNYIGNGCNEINNNSNNNINNNNSLVEQAVLIRM